MNNGIELIDFILRPIRRNAQTYNDLRKSNLLFYKSVAV